MLIMKKNIYVVVLWSVFFVLMGLILDLHALEKQEQTASYEFQNKSVYSILETISRDFNITISAPFDQLQQKVTRSYKDTKIDRIINDVVKKHNHAIVWQYKNRQIMGIDIRLVMTEANNATSRTPSKLNRTAQSYVSASATQAGTVPDYKAGSKGHIRNSGSSLINPHHNKRNPPPQPSIEGLPEGVELPPSMPEGPGGSQARKLP